MERQNQIFKRSCQTSGKSSVPSIAENQSWQKCPIAEGVAIQRASQVNLGIDAS